MTKQIKLLFILRSFEIGGAERQILEITKGLDKRLFEVQVVTYYNKGAFEAEFNSVKGVRLASLGKSGRWDLLFPLFRLLKIGKEYGPDVVHGVSNTSNLLSLLIAKLYKAAVVFGIRNASEDISQKGPVTIALNLFHIALARLSNAVIFNSHAGRDYYRNIGLKNSTQYVVQNGIDVKKFRPNTKTRIAYRKVYGVPEGTTLIGLVARFDPQKDHKTFIRAAALLNKDHSNLMFICAGIGPQVFIEQLKKFAEMLGVLNILWSLNHHSVVPVFNSMDLGISTSIGEGFPNAVAEAMACGVPCIATRVGDTEEIVGETGFLTKVGDPIDLCAKISIYLKATPKDRMQISLAARERIVTHFSTGTMIKTYMKILIDVDARYKSHSW